jgi:inner membrane protein
VKGYLYVTLASEDFALLSGSLALFLLLAALMLATRKVDWYRLSSRPG